MSGGFSPAAKFNRKTGQVQSETCLCYINGRECIETRELWEEVFCEDTEQFTDYYYSVKAPENEGFVLKGEEGLRAMLFLTPEKMRVFEETVPSAYIVGVATRKEWRHRGYMARLLRESFQLMYERKVPFIFLMPASPAIYEPFTFRFIYDRPIWEADSLKMEKMQLLDASYEGQIAAFSEKLLQKTAPVHICRDIAYDRVLWKEIAAQNGQVLGYFENNSLEGICLYTCEEGEADIQEVLAMPQKETEFVARSAKTRPCIMARMVYLPAFLGLLRTRHAGERFSFVLQVEDAQIEENNGSFYCCVSDRECIVSADAVPEERISFFWKGTAAELTERVFGYKAGNAAFENGRQQEELWEKLRLLNPVWINEIV